MLQTFAPLPVAGNSDGVHARPRQLADQEGPGRARPNEAEKMISQLSLS